MGVTGLWKLVEPCGKPVPVDTLENKVFAVDISIWLHQVVKGFQDSKGSALPNAHLIGLFNRLCKLLYYRIRPIFVFDGSVPDLKRATINRRNLKRNKLNNEAVRIQNLLLKSLAKEKVVQQALGATISELLPKASTALPDNADKMFVLPEHSDCDESIIDDDDLDESETSQTDSSMDETNLRKYYNQNLSAIDVKSAHFKNLPADIRHEILVDIKATRKQSSWGHLHELPSQSDDFSSFQMKRLLKRRDVQISLKEAETEMGGKSLTLHEIQNIFTENGVVDSPHLLTSEQVFSDENTRFLLVRDLNRKQSSASKTLSKKEYSVSELDLAMQMSLADSIEYKTENINNNISLVSNKKQSPGHYSLDSEYDKELELAIEMSLADCKEYKIENENNMCSTSGMDSLSFDKQKTPKQVNFAFCDAINKADRKEMDYHEQYSKQSPVEISDTDSDLEEVNDISLESTKDRNVQSAQKRSIEITVDLSKIANCNEDIFADIFEPGAGGEPLSDFVHEKIDLKSVLHKQKDENNIPLAVEKYPADMKKDISLISQQILKDEIPHIDISDTDSDLEEVHSITLKIKEHEKSMPIPNKIRDKSNPLETSTDVLTLSNSEVNCISDKEEITKLSPLILSGNSNIVSEKSLDILNDLKRQMNEITKLDLKDIKIDDPVEEKKMSKDIELCFKSPPDRSTLPLFDLHDKKNILSFAKSKSTSPQSKKNEPLLSRSKSVSPESKDLKRPSSCDIEFPKKKVVRSSEMLFESCNNVQKDDFEKINPLIEKDVQDRLQNLVKDIAKEKKDLEKERNRQDRMGMPITERMAKECMQLLRLFGVPYIVAPMEAEAQCAYLDLIKISNGTITDDSDIWLFGGRTVYKDFFAQNKHVLEYQADHIEKTLKVSRANLIQLAFLVGSDYTMGIHGIGAVTALEILSLFSVNKLPEKEVNSDLSSILSTLCNFRDWWTSKSACGSSAKLSLRKKLKNIELQDGFPSFAVAEAYLRPKVDDCTDAFSWRPPDVESIREFTKTCFGWTRSKTDDILLPVMKRINEKKSQASIKNYFAVKRTVSANQTKFSNRVQKAISRMSGVQDLESKSNKKGGRKTSSDLNRISTSGIKASNIEKPKRNQGKMRKNKGNKNDQ